jgi:hypothetical protein
MEGVATAVVEAVEAAAVASAAAAKAAASVVTKGAALVRGDAKDTTKRIDIKEKKRASPSHNAFFKVAYYGLILRLVSEPGKVVYLARDFSHL